MEDMETGVPGEDGGKISANDLAEADCDSGSEMIEDDDKEGNDEVDAPADKNSDEDSDDKDDDDDDEKDKDDDEDDADEAEVKRLKAALERCSWDYDNNLALISKLRAMGELDDLRAARKNMSSEYPLGPDIWLPWLQDEMKLAATPEQRTAVMELCERALDDYLSAEVWLEYLQFGVGSLGVDADGKKNIRQLFERALTSVGLHVTKGAIIWEAFREFETVVAAMIDPNNEAERKEQLDRVGSLFRRQLACPLLDMEKTLEEFEIWRASDGASVAIDEKIISDRYKRAFEKLTECLPFEEKLVSTSEERESPKRQSELLEVYAEYLQYEKEKGDPARVTVLYERAIADTTPGTWLWLDYVCYLEDNVKIEAILDKVYKRATRNEPWCGKIWQKWMRSMEKWGRPLSEVQQLLENALSAGLSTNDEYILMWISYIEYLRRRIDHEQSKSDVEKQIELIRKTFNRACEHLSELYGLEGDPECVLLQYWARTEAIHADDMEKARSLWSDIMSQGHSAAAASWLEYIALERCYGDTKHLRKLYRRALAAVKDSPERIAKSWIDFERDEGTLEQIEYCETKTTERLQQVEKEREKARQRALHSQESAGPVGKKANKRKSDEGQWKNLGSAPNKQQKVEKPDFKKKYTTSSADLPSTSGGGANKPKIAPPPGYKPPQDEKMESDHGHEVDDKITVFVSNLDYTATEEEVKEALSSAGPITLVKLIRDFKGRSKGFGYVQLSSSDAVEDALKLDRTPIKGRPMFVSRCDPDKATRGPGFKYACALEKNKLFVKGLPVSTTKEELETLFGSHGPLKDVRLVTYRNGHSKGLAYVEFMDEVSAGKALLATDGMTIQDKIINVAISKPPERKREQSDIVSHVKSLGGTSVSRHTFGLPKTLLTMIPHNVKPAGNNNTSIAPGNGVKQPLNNQDFRNMLLNKK